MDLNEGLKSPSKVAEGKRKGRFIDKTKNKSDKYVMMINGVDYIVFLEYGGSQQAPMGMVRISMRKMTGDLPKELGKRYREEWNKI